MKKTDPKEIGNKIILYCQQYNIPIDYFFDILWDQKVTPMIRGKAMEYNVFVLLKKILSAKEWSVQKLNLNPQHGIYDEDIGVIHRRTGIVLKIESKSAVRGSFKDGKKAKKIKEPHFLVKCHRSRSVIKLAGTSNDRYSDDTFDIIISNPSNSILQGNTIGENLEIIHKIEYKEVLSNYYKVNNDKDLLKKCETDWRFVYPKDISENGFIPRTPYVKLIKDDDWKPIKELEKKLLNIVELKRRGKN